MNDQIFSRVWYRPDVVRFHISWGAVSCHGFSFCGPCSQEFGKFAGAAASLRTPKTRPWSAVACYRLSLAKLASPFPDQSRCEEIGVMSHSLEFGKFAGAAASLRTPRRRRIATELSKTDLLS